LFSVYMPLLIKVNGKISASEIFVGYLGLFFLGSAVLAIGLFASALGKELIVAAVVAVAIAVALGNIFQMAQVVDPPLKDAVKNLDLWMRYQGFMGGVFNLKDAVYYGAVTYFFLLLSVKTLEAQRWQ